MRKPSLKVREENIKGGVSENLRLAKDLAERLGRTRVHVFVTRWVSHKINFATKEIAELCYFCTEKRIFFRAADHGLLKLR